MDTLCMLWLYDNRWIFGLPSCHELSCLVPLLINTATIVIGLVEHAS